MLDFLLSSEERGFYGELAVGSHCIKLEFFHAKNKLQWCRQIKLKSTIIVGYHPSFKKFSLKFQSGLCTAAFEMKLKCSGDNHTKHLN